MRYVMTVLRHVPDRRVPAPAGLIEVVEVVDRAHVRRVRLRRHDDQARHARAVPRDRRRARRGRPRARVGVGRPGAVAAAGRGDRDVVKERVLDARAGGAIRTPTSQTAGQDVRRRARALRDHDASPRPDRVAPSRGPRGGDRLRVARRVPRRGRAACSESRTCLCTSLEPTRTSTAPGACSARTAAEPRRRRGRR